MRKLTQWCLVAAWLATPALAQAQTPASNGPYVVVGGGWENKATGIYECGTSISCKDVHTLRPTLILGAGVPVAKRLSLEAAIEWPSTPNDSDVAWRWSYTAPITDNVASHRDVPILLLARWEPGCLGGVCLEPVGGLGVAIHHASNLILSECGSVGVPLPCAPPAPATRTPGTETENSLKFAWAVGVDLRIRLSNRVWLRPGARLTYVADGNDLFEGNQRGPNTGSPVMTTFSVAIVVR